MVAAAAAAQQQQEQEQQQQRYCPPPMTTTPTTSHSAGDASAGGCSSTLDLQRDLSMLFVCQKVFLWVYTELAGIASSVVLLG